ncbi:MAG: hypothetical protein ACLPYW_06335, partial [Acidimicrobiales bacterium]
HDAPSERRCGVDAAEALQSGADKSFRRLRVGKIADAFDDLDSCPETRQIFDEAVGGITDYEVVPTAGKQSTEVRTDVASCIADESDPARH